MSSEERAALSAVMSGFAEVDPVLVRVSEALGTSALAEPRNADGYTAINNDAYEATVGGRAVSVMVLALGRPETDTARVEVVRERVALMAGIQSPYVVQILSPVVVLDGYPGAVCWLEEPKLPDGVSADEGDGAQAVWSVERTRALLTDLGTGVAELHRLGARAWPRMEGIGRRRTGEYVLTNGAFMSAQRMASDAGAHVLDFVPYFQSPEDSLAGAPSLAGDVYTLGVFAFLCLTARPPVTAGSGPSEDFLDYTAEDAEAYTAGLSTMRSPAVQSVRADVPDDLAAVIDRCLEPNVADRYPTATEMVGHLTGG